MIQRIIEVNWPQLGIRVEAKPLPYNQRFLDVFLNSLPFKTIQLHAVVTGEDMYSYCPVSPIEYMHLVEKSVPIKERPVGSVSWSAFGLVAIVYGSCSEPLDSHPFAEIPTRFHEDLRKAGRAAWDSIFYTKQKLIVEFRKKRR